MRERLAVLDQDLDAIVAIVGGDLSGPHRFVRVAEAMVEVGRPDLALHRTGRGIAQSDGWQVGLLYDLACRTHEQLRHPMEVLRFRRAHHQRMPSTSTYGALRSAARSFDAWQVERDAARAALRDTDVDRRAYQQAARILKQARSAAQAAGQLDAFTSTVARLRETHRRRPTLIAILDRAKLTGDAEASRGG